VALPKRRTSKARQGKRRSHWKLTVPNYGFCPRCRAPKMPHRMCPKCGFYNGRLILDMAAKQQNKEKT